MSLPDFQDCTWYTPYFCEENVYRLAEWFDTQRWNLEDMYAIFISNNSKAVLLHHQKAGDDYVVWDYHVILIVCRPGNIQVFDQDSKLSFPTSWTEFKSKVLQKINAPSCYQRLFKLVPAQEFLLKFASDRSHMVTTSNSGKF
jgi:hypothetical protein